MSTTQSPAAVRAAPEPASPPEPVALAAPPRLWDHPRIRRGALALAGAGLALALTWWFAFRPYVTTEDARVAAPVAAVAPSGTGGRIERILVKEGDQVHAGDVLVQLDAAAQRTQVDRARAALAVAQARARAAEAQLDVERRVASSSGQRARAGFDAAQTAYRLAQQDRARAEALSAAEVLPEKDLDRARATAAAAQLGVVDSEGRLVDAGAAGGRILLRQQQLEEARGGAAQAEAELAAAQVALEQMTLRSPFDAVVIRVAVDPGNYVSTGQAVVTIADTGHAWIAANVEETAAGAVRPGQPVRIEVDEGGQVEGHVEVVTRTAASRFALIPADNAAGNFTKVVQRIPLRIAIDGAGAGALRVGESVVARIRVR